VKHKISQRNNITKHQNIKNPPKIGVIPDILIGSVSLSQ